MAAVTPPPATLAEALAALRECASVHRAEIAEAKLKAAEARVESERLRAEMRALAESAEQRLEIERQRCRAEIAEAKEKIAEAKAEIAEAKFETEKLRARLRVIEAKADDSVSFSEYARSHPLVEERQCLTALDELVQKHVREKIEPHEILKGSILCCTSSKNSRDAREPKDEDVQRKWALKQQKSLSPLQRWLKSTGSKQTIVDTSGTPMAETGRKTDVSMLFLSGDASTDALLANLGWAVELKAGSVSEPAVRGQILSFAHKVLRKSSFRMFIFSAVANGKHIQFFQSKKSDVTPCAEVEHSSTPMYELASADATKYLTALLLATQEELGLKLPKVEGFRLRRSLGVGASAQIFSATSSEASSADDRNAVAADAGAADAQADQHEFVLKIFTNDRADKLAKSEREALLACVRAAENLDTEDRAGVLSVYECIPDPGVLVMGPVLERTAAGPDVVWTRFHTMQLINFLQFMHEEAGFVHRDIRPDNLMFNKSGRLFVIDFAFSVPVGVHSVFCGGIRWTSCRLLAKLSANTEQELDFNPRDDLHAAVHVIYSMHNMALVRKERECHDSTELRFWEDFWANTCGRPENVVTDGTASTAAADSPSFWQHATNLAEQCQYRQLISHLVQMQQLCPGWPL